MARARKRRPKQLDLRFRPWGGRRAGAGRKPNRTRAGVSHLTRAPLGSAHGVLVTLRVKDHVYNLRSRRCFRVIERAFEMWAKRGDSRLVHYAVLGNHMHLIAEADSETALARSIQGLCVRIARGLNRVMGKRGSVFADRYHARVLKGPRAVRAAMSYVLNNAHRHRLRTAPRRGWVDEYSSGRGFDGWRRSVRCHATGPPPVRAPRSWLLRKGWRRLGLLDPDEVPGRP